MTTTPVSCLTDTSSCLNGTITPAYSSVALGNYCIPVSSNLEGILDLNSFERWAFDIREGWVVLVVSLFVAIFLSFMFLLVVRWCAVPLIWLSIFLLISSTLTVGILFILEARGVTVSSFISSNLPALTFDALLTLGIYLIVTALFLTLLVICLRSRIMMGANAVKLGSLFIFENCMTTMLPITFGCLILLALVGLITGGISLYSDGQLSFPNNRAVPEIHLSGGQIALIIFFIFAGLWTVFFLNGCNNFLLCSAVAIWYYSHSGGSTGAPCCDSFWRLLRYHWGSVALSSMLNSSLFVLKVLANILSFDVDEDDSSMVSCCLSCLNYFFCLFRVY